MKQYILDSFISKKGGGNKAAVVLDDKNLHVNEMLNIAKKNNFSETAFINICNSNEEEFCIRYFTPVEEVDICGHAALASFTLLDNLKMFNRETTYHKTKAGKLRIIKRNKQIMIEMKTPILLDKIKYDEIYDITNLKEDNIVIDELGPELISTGLSDIIFEVRNLKALREMNVNNDKMIKLKRERNILGMHVVSRETIEDDSMFTCRNFAPAVGIYEESATGTSNASMLYQMLRKNRIETEKVYKIEQGYFMNSPSNIYGMIEKINDKLCIYVGGYAKIVKLEELL